MNKWTAAPLALVAALACDRGGTGVAARIPADSSEFYRTQVEQMTTVAAAKDSLVRDLAETLRTAQLLGLHCTRRRSRVPLAQPGTFPPAGMRANP